MNTLTVSSLLEISSDRSCNSLLVLVDRRFGPWQSGKRVNVDFHDSFLCTTQCDRVIVVHKYTEYKQSVVNLERQFASN